MKQGKRRSVYWSFLYGLSAVVLAIAIAGCHARAPSAVSGELIPQGPGSTNNSALNNVQPSQFMPGNVIELHGHGFPVVPEDIRVNFSPAQNQGSNPILGVPFSVSKNMITVLVPTGAPTGQVTLSVIQDGKTFPLGSNSITVSPLIIGYVAKDTPRIPGVVEGDILLGNSPQDIILYGLNIDQSIVSASLRVMAADHQNVAFQQEISVSSSGFMIEGVSDPRVKGASITLPDRLSDYFQTSGITYVQFQLRGANLQSNMIEIPMLLRSIDLPGEYSTPFPAFISGVWVNPGVHGNLLEVYYTVFQPVVVFKWHPVLEMSLDSGRTWLPGVINEEPDLSSGDLGSPDYRTNMIIAGDSKQTPEKPCMAGPGTTYRILVNVHETWPNGSFALPNIGGQVRLKLHLESEVESHSEVPNISLIAPLQSNYFETPYVSVATNYDGMPADNTGIIKEEFEDRENYSPRDNTSNLQSNGAWGSGGVATGPSSGQVITGSGMFPLDETVFLENRVYLFDTDSGRLYLFPDFSESTWTNESKETLINNVRENLGKTPESFGLTEVWVGSNTTTTIGEIQTSKFVLPNSVTLYARGLNPFVIRVSGGEGGLTAEINGEIILDGLPGQDGAEDSLTTGQKALQGSGGIGGPGGGRGGSGGFVRTGVVGQAVKVTGTLNAEAGQWGGGPGQTLAYTLPYSTGDPATKQRCFVYGGAGGGGGFGSAGKEGRPGARLDGSNRYSASGANPWSNSGDVYRVDGKGGPERGSDELLPIIGGSGGGGGGGFLARSLINGNLTNFGVGGGGGGGGGGAFKLVARGSVSVSGKISSKGGHGGVGRGKALASGGSARDRGDWSGSCGGGGSGGSILIQATESLIFSMGAELDVSGGDGGRPGLTTDSRYLDSNYYPIGGDGGRGRIRLEASRGVNLPSNINLTGISPALSDSGPTTIGPILKPVDKGNSMHGPVDLSSSQYDGINDFFIEAPEAGDVEHWASIYYIDPNTSERIDVLPVFFGSREFNLSNLIVPEGKRLIGKGNVPIIIHVQNDVTIAGEIDVSGQEGGIINESSGTLFPGNGGSPGPGGGKGGSGAYGGFDLDTGLWGMADAENGSLPPNITASGGSGYLPDEGWDDRDFSVDLSPSERGLSFSPILCSGDCTGLETQGGAGGGGGGFGDAGEVGPAVSGDLLDNGAGGLPYGYHWHLAENVDEFYGGSGGGGGGASTNGAVDNSAVPGSGGGGGGGCIVFDVGGDMNLSSTGIISADGGDAYSALETGGNGGAGSGGSVLVRVNGNLTIENGAIISALGGKANQTPPSIPAGYSKALDTGGNGAPGRIRIELPGGDVGGGEDVVTVLLKPDGIIPSVGTAFTGSEVISYVWSKPFALSLGNGKGIMMTDGKVFENQITAILLQNSFLSPIARWRLLVDGSEASCQTRAVADRFFGPMSYFGSLNDLDYKPSYMRFMLVFVGSSLTSEVPQVDLLSIPWAPVDYSPPAPPPGP